MDAILLDITLAAFQVLRQSQVATHIEENVCLRFLHSLFVAHSHRAVVKVVPTPLVTRVRRVVARTSSEVTPSFTSLNVVRNTSPVRR